MDTREECFIERFDAVGGEDAAVIFDMAEANQICVS